MRALVSGAVVCLLSGFAFTQDLLPELAGPAGTYKTAAEALERYRLEAAAQAAGAYVGALDGIGKSAAAKGEVKTVEAAAKEREAALAGRLAAELPAELPALRLQGSRRALLRKQEKLNADAAGRKKRLDSQYLGVLASLAAKAGPESALGKQVAAEREAVLAAGKENDGGDGANGGEAKADKVPRGKNVVVNGDFEKVGADGKPEGWEGTRHVTIESENNNRFMRFMESTLNRDGTVSLYMLSQALELPENARTVRITSRLRAKGEGNGKMKDTRWPRVYVEFKNKEGKAFCWVHAVGSEKIGTWSEIDKEDRIPKEAVRAEVIVSNDRCTGQIDFDDVEVTFK